MKTHMPNLNIETMRYRLAREIRAIRATLKTAKRDGNQHSANLLRDKLWGVLSAGREIGLLNDPNCRYISWSNPTWSF